MNIQIAATIIMIPNSICMFVLLDCLIVRCVENNMPHSKIFANAQELWRNFLKRLLLLVFAFAGFHSS